MALEQASENSRQNEVQPKAPLVAWNPSPSDYHGLSPSIAQQRTNANQCFIDGGVFNNVVIDFTSDPVLAQAVQYRDYATTQPSVSAQPGVFQNRLTQPKS
ncbi:hypothetical protein BH10CYA1_BH10CYA1_08840 [soil metagenome]